MRKQQSSMLSPWVQASAQEQGEGMAMAQAECPRLPQVAAAAVVAAAAAAEEPRWLAMALTRTCRPAWTTSESPERLVAACLQASTVIVEMRGCSVALRSLRAWAYGTAHMPDNDIDLDDMDAIDITALRHFITQRRDAVWEGLDVCPRTCPSVGARLCTYAAWFARPPHKHARSLLDLPLSSRCMQTLFRFRMGVHRLPKDEGSWSRVPRHERLCLLCNLGSLCDEKHVVFECSALQGLRDEYASLFSDVCTMKQFLWQDDLVSVAKFIHASLDKMFSCETGLSNDSQASDQPDVAGRDVT